MSSTDHKLSLLDRHPNIKNHVIAAIGEFVGTTLFIFFALGGTNVSQLVSSEESDCSQLLYIALSFGFSLTINAWVFFRISGGLFNPAVSLALACVGAISPLRAVILTVSQLAGGIVGPALLVALIPGDHLNVQTTLTPGMNLAQGVFMEAFLTSMLILTIFLLAAEKHRATFLAPIGIGLSLFIAELFGVHWTGGSLNPARSFGPAVVARKFHSDHWVYWVGPLAGALFSVGFYKFMKLFDYQTVSPNIDADHVVVQEKTKAILASAGITIDAKTGAIGMSRGGTAIGMSSGGTAMGQGGATAMMSRNPTFEGTGFGDGFNDALASNSVPSVGTIFLPSPSTDARVDSLDQKLDWLIQTMVQNSPKLGDRIGSAALAATAPSRMSMSAERSMSSSGSPVGMAY